MIGKAHQSKSFSAIFLVRHQKHTKNSQSIRLRRKHKIIALEPCAFLKSVSLGDPIFSTINDHTFSPLFELRFKKINFGADFGILVKKSAVEISVFLIDLPNYHFLHQTEDNPSFDYYDVLFSDIFGWNFSKHEEFEFEIELKFLNTSWNIWWLYAFAVK